VDKYLIQTYSTTSSSDCPSSHKHRPDAMKRRDASTIASMARRGHVLFINLFELGDTVARKVPVALRQCDCLRGYQLDPWSPHYERPDETLS
jgi:hypothetical protein